MDASLGYLQGSHYVLLLEIGHEFKPFLSILLPYISESKYSTHLDILLEINDIFHMCPLTEQWEFFSVMESKG